jgi:hypothetical protein
MAYSLFFILHHVLTRHSLIQNTPLDPLENDRESIHLALLDVHEVRSNRRDFCLGIVLLDLALRMNLYLFFMSLG